MRVWVFTQLVEGDAGPDGVELTVGWDRSNGNAWPSGATGEPGATRVTSPAGRALGYQDRVEK